jgi:hypothetical protein
MITSLTEEHKMGMADLSKHSKKDFRDKNIQLAGV